MGDTWIRGRKRIDCDGVLPLWFDSSDLTKWYSTNRGRTEGGCELLSSWLILPS